MFLIEGSKLKLKQEDAFNARPIFLDFFWKIYRVFAETETDYVLLVMGICKNIVNYIG